MPTMKDIDKTAADYARARNALNAEVIALDTAIRRLLRARRATIARLAEQCRDHRTELKTMVVAGKEMFERPKTKVLHGIKVGFRKGTGKLSWFDEQEVVANIRKRFDEKAWPTYLKTTVTPIKASLNALPAVDARKLGVTITEAHDQVVVEPVQGDAEAMAETLLADPPKPKKGGRK